MVKFDLVLMSHEHSGNDTSRVYDFCNNNTEAVAVLCLYVLSSLMFLRIMLMQMNVGHSLSHLFTKLLTILFL